MSITNCTEIYKENWPFKDETIKYIEKYLYCLYQIIISANRQVFSDYKFNITDVLTISGLAMKIFLSRFFDKNITRVNRHSVYIDIKQAY